MSLNIGNEASKIKVYKDEKGRYSTYIKGQELKENGETEDIFMLKKLQFRKGVELKNKTVIEVVKGWANCYRIKGDKTNEKGESVYRYYDKYFISEFNVVENGTDEVQKSYESRQAEKELKEQDDYSFDYSISDDDLPF